MHAIPNMKPFNTRVSAGENTKKTRGENTTLG